MAAKNNINPDQLSMFMTPEEIKGYMTTSGDLHQIVTPEGHLRNETMEELWDRKLEASKAPKDSGHGAGVYDALSEGIDILDQYIQFGGPALEILHNSKGDRYLGDMHHRIAAQADIDKQQGTQTFLPISHFPSEFVAPKPGEIVIRRTPQKWTFEEIPFDEAT